MAGLKSKTNGHLEESVLAGQPEHVETDPSNLDRVRDILFGHQARDFERRFSKLEERLGEELSELRRELLERVASLEAYVQQENRALDSRIAAEAQSRSEAGEQQLRALELQRLELEKRVVALQDRLTTAEAALRSSLLEQGNRFTDELRALRESSRVSLEREASELRASKTDRVALANLFAELAAGLGA